MGNILRFFDRIQRPSLRQGVIFGLGIGVVEIVLWLLANFIIDATIRSILGTLALAAFLVLGYMAGQRAARETGKMGTGVAAGFWAGLIGGVLEGLIPFIIDLVFLPTIVTNIQQDFKAHPANYPGVKLTDITASYVLIANVESLIYALAFYAVIALLGGALGGFLGRRQALANQGADFEYGRNESENSVEVSEEVAESEQLPAPKRPAKSASVADDADE